MHFWKVNEVFSSLAKEGSDKKTLSRPFILACLPFCSCFAHIVLLFSLDGGVIVLLYQFCHCTFFIPFFLKQNLSLLPI